MLIGTLLVTVAMNSLDNMRARSPKLSRAESAEALYASMESTI